MEEKGDEESDWCGSGELDGNKAFAAEVDEDADVDKSTLSDPVVVTAVISRGLALVVVDAVVVDCPFL